MRVKRMLKSTEMLIDNQLNKHLIRDRDLAQVFKGSDARRYALVNKALKKNELLRICRGLYMLAPKYNSRLFSNYYLANHIVSNSFVTAESALSFHGWIPERVTQVTSATAFSRSREFKTPYGVFLYKHLPVASNNFYLGVKRDDIDNQIIYMATPLRALLDYIYWHKIENADRDFLVESLRIESTHIDSISKTQIKQLKSVYKLKYIQTFLNQLQK